MVLGGLKTAEAIDLVRALDQREESGELGIDLVVRPLHRLEKGWIADQEVTTEAGLFIDDEFDKAVCVEDDHVGTVDCVGAFLNAA
jgi:hypothetical protein